MPSPSQIASFAQELSQQWPKEAEECSHAQELYRTGHVYRSQEQTYWMGHFNFPKNPILEQVKEIAKLQSGGSRGYLEDRVRRLEEIVKAQASAISELRKERDLPAKGLYQTWMESKEAEKYVGKYIAWTRKDGVIASSNKSSEVISKIRNDPRKKDVVLGYIPHA